MAGPPPEPQPELEPMDRAPEFLLWGVPELRSDSVVVFAPERRFQLLSLLGIQSGRWVERDRIAALLWPDRPLAEARRNLRKVLFKAHAVPGIQGLEATEPVLRWTVATDVLAFDADLRAGRIPQALSRRRGVPLEGIDDPANAAFCGWLSAERARLEQRWHDAAMDHLHALADPQARLDAARRLLAVDPFDEPAMAALLQAERDLGRSAEAHADFRQYAVRLAEQLGVEPSRALRALLDDAPGIALPGHPPVEKDFGFIGRKVEMAELRAMFARPECRLVTLLGPGGIGKSSLARHARDELGERHSGGSLWIELQDLEDAAQVVARIALAAGIEINDAKDPVEPIGRRLSGAPVLLVLDNAEHLSDLPALIDRLLAAAPPLRLLVSSRARLHSAHEWLLPLQGLAVPDEESRDVEAASSFDAVRLFEARAVTAQRRFRLDRHLAAVIDITAAVGGMPLAIELAASWVRLLPAEEIARELRTSIDLLQRDPAARDQPARPQHESIRAVLEQAWQRLMPRERQALAALSVFHGGFTRVAAQGVAAVPLPLLSALADKSLIVTDEDGRFSMHPLVAAYAAEMLQREDESEEQVRIRHAEHFARYLALLAPHAIGDQRLLVAGVTAEYANCRAAWQWAVQSQRVDLVYALVRALWTFFEVRGRYVEGIALLSPALALAEQLPGAPRALTRLRHGLSMLHHRKGEARQALALARSGIDPGEHCGDTEAYVGCLLNTAMCLWADGRAQDSRVYYERAVEVSKARLDRHCTLWSLGNLGICLHSLGELDVAQEMLETAVSGLRELGDRYALAVNLNNLAGLLRDREQPQPALAMYEEGLGHCGEAGLASIGLYIGLNSAKLMLRMGRLDHAAQRFEAVRRESHDMGLLPVECSANLCLGRIAIEHADWVAARRRLKVVAALARVQAWRLETASLVDVYGDLLAAEGKPAEAAAAWRAALAQGVLDSAAQRGIADKLATLPAASEAPDRVLSIELLLAQIEA